MAQTLSLSSPDNQLVATFNFAKTLNYTLSYDGKQYLLPSAIEMHFDDGRIIGINPKIVNQQHRTINDVIKPVYGISNSIKENYNELAVDCGDYSVIFRAYNEGFAYRFVTRFKDSVKVTSEQSEFRFAGNYTAYFHPALSEADYRVQGINRALAPNYSSMPLLLKANDGMHMLVHESDVLDFPCMSLKLGDENTLVGGHAAYPKTVKPAGHANFNLKVIDTENYIAKTLGNRNYPWRLVAFEKDAKDILTNQLVYLLASDNRLKDVSWIKPGKVAWDWWNEENLTGVNFKTGFNTATYKYFIDFAARNHIDYVNLDEGWSDQFDLLKATKAMDIPGLIDYAKSKHVGIILWCVWYTLDRQMIPALEQFKRWGVSGIKVDFMDRDDQYVVNFQERLSQEAAKRHMLVNFHGAYHPTGMSRTYPNWINTEGVKGLEWNKFDTAGTSPLHDVEIPFIRMFAGSMDYTPGAMNNYNKTDWKNIYYRPESQGTRCHQLAMYMVYYAPLQMLSDAPTAYEKEPAYLKFLSSIPTVWDETVPLAGEVSQTITVARRKDRNWYIGAMTNWDARKQTIKLDFLKPDQLYTVEIFSDGPNADRVGSDYTRNLKTVKKGDVLQIEMAPGGGWAAIIKPIAESRGKLN